MTDRNRPLSVGALAAQVLLEKTQESVFVLDAQDCVVDLNPAARQLLGPAAGAVLGQPITQWFTRWPETTGRFAGDGAGSGEIVVAHRQAADRQFLLRIWALQGDPSQDDAPQSAERRDGCLAVLREITDVQQMATERDRAHRIAEAAHKNLFVTDRRLAELEQLKSEFIANVSHGLRTPVANLQLYLYLLQQSPGEEQHRYVAALQNEVRGLEQLVADILDFARGDAGEEEEDFVVVDLEQLVNLLLPAYRAEAAAREIAFSFQTEATSLLVWSQPDRLTKAISHLLDNALAYTEQGTITVRLSLNEDRRTACLDVQDTGPGIHAADLPYLFRRFYRGFGVRETNKPSLGLGLSLVKQVVAAHKGNVQVESQVGEGSLFRIQLPLAT